MSALADFGFDLDSRAERGPILLDSAITPPRHSSAVSGRAIPRRPEKKGAAFAAPLFSLEPVQPFPGGRLPWPGLDFAPAFPGTPAGGPAVAGRPADEGL
jgi:hypothetical protein